MSKIAAKKDWADDFDNDAGPDDFHPTTVLNPDGTRTETTYALNDAGQRIRITRRTRTVTKKHVVNARVASRRAWPKFGLEKNRPAGPQPDTTSLGEEVFLNLRVPAYRGGRAGEKEEEDKNGPPGGDKEKLKNMKVKCRICDGDHFTARCPFKDTMAPIGGEGIGGGSGADAAEEEAMLAAKEGGLAGGQSGGYVPPHLRKGGAGARGEGERMGGRYERDDLATLRVTNVSEFAEENDLREIFERFGRVTRVFLAKDRETGRAKGFAFISFQERGDAAKACEKVDGYGYGHLILRVEFAKRAT